MSTRTHHQTVRWIVDLVADEGPTAALDILRDERPSLSDGQYHDTLAVYLVWAADRLLAGGLTRTAVLWHPLVHGDSPLSWWDAATWRSSEAAHHFVAPTLARLGEPCPAEPGRTLVAA